MFQSRFVSAYGTLAHHPECLLRVTFDRGHHGDKSLDVRSTSNSDRVFSSLSGVAMGHERTAMPRFVLVAGALYLTDWSLAARLRCCSAAHSEVRILIFAGDYDLRVDLWQRLGGPHPLWRT
jgi:hypothetical protein